MKIGIRESSKDFQALNVLLIAKCSCDLGTKDGWVEEEEEEFGCLKKKQEHEGQLEEERTLSEFV